jgi:hypothetical protein
MQTCEVVTALAPLSLVLSALYDSIAAMQNNFVS